jgi:CheY-like chemotaxis protein
MPDSTPVVPTNDNSAELDPSKLVKQATPQAPAGTAKKILVVEDEPDARTMFVDLLSMEGYEVSSAVDGVDALAKAAAEKFDLILLDIVMPNKDGLEVLEELKADTTKYGTPIVVMLTNISGDAAVEKAMELGAVGFKLKIGTEPDQLLKDVAAFMAGKVDKPDMAPTTPSTTEMQPANTTEATPAAPMAPAATETAMPAPAPSNVMPLDAMSPMQPTAPGTAPEAPMPGAPAEDMPKAA